MTPDGTRLKMRSVLTLTALVLLSACGPFRGAAGNPNAVTLCVSNNAVMGTLRVWTEQYGRTHNVRDGGRVCRQIGEGTMPVRVFAETIGGGMRGPARGQATLPAQPGECWIWDFRGVADYDNLLPCN
jgi:hypothetical protein